jgi:hypothetical protein
MGHADEFPTDIHLEFVAIETEFIGRGLVHRDVEYRQTASSEQHADDNEHPQRITRAGNSQECPEPFHENRDPLIVP